MTRTIEAAGSRALTAWNLAVSFALAGLGFFLPFSSAGVAIFLAALLALLLMRPRLLWDSAPWRVPVLATGLLLFAYITVQTLAHATWTPDTRSAINRYQELVLAPLVFAMFGEARHRKVFYRSLVVGAFVLAVAAWLAPVVPALANVIGPRRISAGFALAVCAFLLVTRARNSAAPWPSRIVAGFFALTVLYAIDGRTGQVVLVGLAAWAAWQYSPRRWRLAASLGGVVVIVALALGSSVVAERVKETMAGSNRGEAVTSTSIRIELMRVSWELVKRHALAGVGYANYPQAHAEAADDLYNVPAEGVRVNWMRSKNPHNEFLLQLICGGIVGLGLYIAWLGLAFRAAARARKDGSLLGGATFAFALGCLFNSLLLDFVEGHFYMALLAWLLAEQYASADETRRMQVGRLLVVATRQIGDVLLTTPVIRAARERWPQARIDVLGFEGTLGMLRGNPDIAALIETPPRGQGSAWRRAMALWRRYDLALVTDPGDRAHLIGWIAAPVRSGIVPEQGRSNWWKHLWLDHAVEAAGDRGTRHVAVEKCELLAPWLPTGVTPAVHVAPPPGAPLPADLDAALSPTAVVVHAPSMWPYKQWPLAHFETLVKALLAEGRQVVLTGSAGARDQECIAPLRALAGAPQLLVASGRLDFNQLATLLARAALYIGPDTSVSHLAAAVGLPVIAIFGPTNPQRWAPWPAKAQARALFERSALVQHAGNVTLLQSALPCVPCGRAGCEDHRQSRSDCLPDITPERVLEQARMVRLR